MREIVIVISDLYLPPAPSGRSPGPVQGQLESPPGTPGPGTFPGIEHVARFGARTALEGGGWRPWLARWLGRDDLTSVAPAVIAAAAVEPVADAVSAAAQPTAHAESAAVAVSAAAQPSAHAESAAVAVSAAAQPTPRAAAAAVTPVIDTGPAITAANPAAAALPPTSTAWIATPVHLIAGLTSLHLDRRGILRLPTADLETLAQDFNQTFGDSGLRLTPLAAGDFLMQGPATLTAATTEPARALVADLEASLPKGNEAKALKRLGAELEMWLHAHPLNETRRRRGELPVSTLWLWGGGQAPTPMANTFAPSGAATAAAETAVATHTPQQPTPPVARRTTQHLTPPAASPSTDTTQAFGNDPYLAGLSRLQGDHPYALPDRLTDVLTNPNPQQAVLVVELTPMLHQNPQWTVLEALAEIDRRFVSPAIAALGEGVINSVVLIANDTQWSVRRRDRLKFWRRPRPGISALQTPFTRSRN